MGTPRARRARRRYGQQRPLDHAVVIPGDAIRMIEF
jgi:hypothetical protein